jgi:hypothetical protein
MKKRKTSLPEKPAQENPVIEGMATWNFCGIK